MNPNPMSHKYVLWKRNTKGSVDHVYFQEKLCPCCFIIGFLKLGFVSELQGVCKLKMKSY